MAVFRIERTRDYTVMSNHHLRNHQLSLKAKGLLSMMLSLPDDWNYTTRGLAKICKEGVDAIGGALRELESAGYIVRHQLRDRQGRISDTEYVIYEQPQPRQPETPQPDTAAPDTDSPDTDSPDTAFPYLDKPDTEKPAELNIEKSNTQKSITQRARTDSIPFREPAAARPPERKGRDAISLAEMENNLTYTKSGDYLIPDLSLSEQPKKPLGKYGRMRKAYLKEHRPLIYNHLLMSEKLYPHLLEIEETANSRLEQMMPQLAESAGATEELKARDPMRWVGLMNTCKAQAEEILLTELINS